MQNILNALLAIWSYFATNVLNQPAFMIGFIVLIGYILERKNAVNAGIMQRFGRSFADTMLLLLFIYIINILLVRFSKYTKLRAVFTTGNVQVQQAATAFWLILFCFPKLNRF